MKAAAATLSPAAIGVTWRERKEVRQGATCLHDKIYALHMTYCGQGEAGLTIGFLDAPEAFALRRTLTNSL